MVDLPTAFYMAGAQLDNGKVVGQFPAPTGADAEHFSVVLAKGSALTTCINGAIKADHRRRLAGGHHQGVAVG